MPRLVDTHALLWFVFDDPRLSRRAADDLGSSDALLLSVASLWEIAVKVSIDKLRLGMPYEAFIETCVTGREIELLPIKVPHLIEYTNLPIHHRDPFDRLLIAQARVERCAVISADARFNHYDIEIRW